MPARRSGGGTSARIRAGAKTVARGFVHAVECTGDRPTTVTAV
ncbi:MAG: hypothetical protein JWN54_2469 [Mycobacterium sp.]|nr:hypothetical protein [Mycobacterium sp.]